MRLSMKNYLKAFPREDKPAQAKGPEGPGSVTEEADRQEAGTDKKDPEAEKPSQEDTDQEGDDQIEKENNKEGSD